MQNQKCVTNDNVIINLHSNHKFSNNCVLNFSTSTDLPVKLSQKVNANKNLLAISLFHYPIWMQVEVQYWAMAKHIHHLHVLLFLLYMNTNQNKCIWLRVWILRYFLWPRQLAKWKTMFWRSRDPSLASFQQRTETRKATFNAVFLD